MTTADLKSTLSSTNASVLLDVRLEDDFEAAHIPGAQNARVFEVSFLDQVAAIVSDQSKAIVVYGFGGGSKEAEVAADKLQRGSYTNVTVFEDGLDAWTSAGEPIEGSGTAPAPFTPPDGRKNLNLAESRVEWLGRNLLNKHWGTLGLRSGHLDFENGSLTGGEITIDMNALECTDLSGDPLHDILIAHLKNDDFFDVSNHPTAVFHINEVTEFPQTAASEPNVEIGGDLTLRGVTNPVHFTAMSGLSADGAPAAQAAFAIDRTEWGVIYGSGKFFRRLAGHLVSDMIELQLRIVCEE